MLPSKSKYTLCIIDDDVEVRRLYETQFRSEGYNVVVADDGESGWELVGRVRPILILLEVGLSKKNGIYFLEKISKDKDLVNIPVVVMTKSDNSKFRDMAYDLGVVYYLDKFSFGPKEMSGVVERVLKI